jgi:hypothetical protein
MRVRALLLSAAMIPSALFAVAAGTPPEGCSVLAGADTVDTTDDDVLACTSAAYLSCDQVLDGDAAGKVHSPIENVGLTDDAPTESFTAGAGCGEVEAASVTGTAMTNIYDLNVAGYLTGNVDTITFELHSIYAGAQRGSGTMNVDVRFDVGGVAPNGVVENTPTGTGDVTETPAPIRFQVDPATSATGASESLTFSVTDLFANFPELSVLGDGSENYQSLNLTVSISQTDYAGAYVWGAEEIPASITLNAPSDLLGTVISANMLNG